MEKRIIRAFNCSSVHLYRAILVLSYMGFIKGTDYILKNPFAGFLINILKFIVMYFVIKFVVGFISNLSESE